MPAARHDVGQLRPAHEGGVVAVAAGDLLHRAAQEQHRVGRLEARQGRKRELKLAGAELDLERPQRQAEGFEVLSQNLHDRIDEIVALLGKVLIAGGKKLHVRRGAGLARIGGPEVRIEDPEDMKLHFQAGDEVTSKALDRFAQQLPRAVRQRPRALDVDRKSTRLNSSHVKISYAVFCLKKKKKKNRYSNTVQ